MHVPCLSSKRNRTKRRRLSGVWPKFTVVAALLLSCTGKAPSPAEDDDRDRDRSNRESAEEEEADDATDDSDGASDDETAANGDDPSGDPPTDDPNVAPDGDPDSPDLADDSDPANDTETEEPDPTPGSVSQPLRRLSHFEYANTLRDLFGELPVTLPDFAADETIDGFSNHWDGMQPSPLLTEQYFSVARSIAETLDATSATELAGCSEQSCAGTFIESFGLRAFRRPLTDAEIEMFLELFTGEPGASDFTLGVQLTVMAMLQSPHFLYRLEFGVGDVVDERGKPLDAYETASRLSYLLWATMPDDALFEAAASGGLSDASEIEAEARRLLADPQSRASVERFFVEWLELQRLRTVLKLPEAGWDEGFRAELVESALRFVVDEVFERGGTSADLLTSTRFVVTAGVAALFGESVDGEDYAAIDADPDERAGILTHPAFLGAHGYGEYGSPVLRGVYVMDRMLCSPPSPPPGDVMIVLPETPEVRPDPRTNREAYVEATSGGVCEACHTAINGFGFAFEHYDTLGQYRTTDSGIEVDASGSLAGFEFENAVEFVTQLSEDERYQACVVEKWVNYALGGSPLAEDARFLLDVRRSFEAADFELRELLVAIAVHERFSGFLATTEAP